MEKQELLLKESAISIWILWLWKTKTSSLCPSLTILLLLQWKLSLNLSLLLLKKSLKSRLPLLSLWIMMKNSRSSPALKVSLLILSEITSKSIILLYWKLIFCNSENRDPNADFKRFGNASSISSAQYHGNSSKGSGIDVAQSKYFHLSFLLIVLFSNGKCQRILQ